MWKPVTSGASMAVVAAVAAGLCSHGGLLAQTRPSDSRLAEARRELGEAVQEGVAGRVLQRTPGDLVFVPERGDLPSVPLSPGSADASRAVGLPLIVRGTVDDGAFALTSFTLRRPRFSDRLEGKLGLNTDRLLNAVERAIQPPPASTPATAAQPREFIPPPPPRLIFGAGSPLDTQARITFAELLDEYNKAWQQGRPADAKAIAERWSDLRRYVPAVNPLEEKAIYGDLDNYSPWRYEVIYRQSAATVALAKEGDTTSFCSGVLITPDLVLTAAHCFAPTRLPEDVEAWFRYVDGPGDPPPARRRRTIAGFAMPDDPAVLQRRLEHQFGPDLLDYVIVRLGAWLPTADGSPALDPEPQCLRRASPHKGDALYVLGYPLGQPAQVHDSARVYLPYRVLDGEEFLKLRLNVDADLLPFSEHDELLREFDASYASSIVTDGFRWRVLRDIRSQGQPQMGIVADTFRGNSGGPVYERDRRQCVVGLLVQGAADIGRRREPNWKEHEHVLPMSAILEDLAGSPAGQAVAGALQIE